MGLLSIKEDEDAAEALGVATGLYKWVAFGLSALFPGLLGAVMALRWNYIDPYTAFNPITSFQVVVMAFLGSAATVPGPIVGAVFLALVSEVLWARYPYFYMLILGVVLILVVIFLPRGVWPPLKRLIPLRLTER